jgi:ABC-type glutathione transport system ATPase component
MSQPLSFSGQSVSAAPLARLRGLGKRYVSAKGPVQALIDFDLDIPVGRSVALVGESGSGKTTAAMCLAGLMRPDSGRVEWQGQDFFAVSARVQRSLRAQFGLVLQNPLTSFDPRVRISASVAEPLAVHRRELPARERRAQALAGLQRVGLSEALGQRFPHQLSGGQLQRAAIARALVLEPRLLILDEPTSALDVSVQAQVINLLADLQTSLGISYLFITHNLALVGLLADELVVMRAGQAVERGPVSEVLAAPRHAYTRALLTAVPTLDAPAASALRLFV